MDEFLFALTLVAVLGCGLAAGVFFAFSSFVMKALGRLPAVQGIAAMQSINVVAVTPAFMTALFGTGVVCIAVMIAALFELGESFAVYQLVGGALYLVGVIGLTMGYHVPRNNALAKVEPASPDAASLWARYVAEWTALNHVRAAAPAAASAAFAVALYVG